MTANATTGRILTRRQPNRARFIVTCSPELLQRLRVLADTIPLKGTKRPTVPTLARRAIDLYTQRLTAEMRCDSRTYTAEVAALDALVTPTPQPAKRSKVSERD